MREKIKILQSVESLGVGGNEIFVMNFFRHINKDNFQVDFVVYDDSRMDFYDEIISSGSKVYICKSNVKNQYLDTIIKIIKVKKILLKNKYDIIHCHSCSFLGIFRGAVAGKITKGIKVISHSHNPGIPKNNFIDNLIRKTFKYFLSCIVDLGFACSDVAAKSKYTKKFMKSKKFKIINNAVEVKKFLFNKDVRKEMREKYNIANELVIGNIGRLEFQKNQEYLLKVFVEIKKKNNLAKLIIIGEGTLESQLKNYSKNKGIDKDVIFTGKVDDCEKYYNMMDVFVLTSKYEGFPFVMVESQINRLPSVVSSAITKSVNIFDNVSFIDLEKSKKEWANIILNSGGRINDSTDYKNKCKNYDLEYQTRELENFYLELLD